MQEYLQAIATLFSLINPIVCLLMFSNLAVGRTTGQRTADALRTIAVISVVLVMAAFAGAHILRIFGISLDAFSVAGGVVLSFIGFRMLAGTGTPQQPGASTSTKQEPNENASYTSLILFAASPGTITGVITVTAAHDLQGIVPVTALVAIGVVLAITLVLLLLASASSNDGSSQSSSLARDMVGRYMGLIVVSMGVQFILTGYKAFMAA